MNVTHQRAMAQLSADWNKRLGEPYLPGSGREPPRMYFDDIKTTIPVRVDAEVLVTAPAFSLARDLYSARYFWEANEVLEALSSAALPNTKTRHFLQGLIHLTNACLKVRMQQPNAAVRLVRETERHLIEATGLDIPFDIGALLMACDGFRVAIVTGTIGDAMAERPSLERLV